MREILFRGKRIDNGKWVEGRYGEYTLISGKSVPCISILNEVVCGSICYDVEASTIGQFTGLTDKNGKKIFEGDICEFDNDEPDESERYTNYAIQWDCVNCKYVVVDGRNCEDCLDIFFAKHAEVIGNIYDNPELLEVEE